MRGATHASDGSEESLSITDVGVGLARKVGRILGEDQQGREHVVWPARGEVEVREADGTHATVETIDMGAKDRHAYRVFVERETDVDVDWNEEAF